MDIRNVGNHGHADRTGERARRVEHKRAENARAGAGANIKDDAQISATGRETAAAVEELAERARGDDPKRDALIKAVRQKLENGDLDDAAIFLATARNLADRGFLSA